MSRGRHANGSAGKVRNRVSDLCIVFIALCPLFCATFCYAAPHDEYKKIQKEIKTQKQKLEEVKRRESSVLSEIELTSRQMKAAEYELKRNRDRLTNTEVRIAKVESEISRNKGNIEKHREWMKRKLRAIYKYGRHPDSVMLFMGTADISQLMRSSKNLQYITLYERNLLESYKDTLSGLSEREKQLVTLKRELVRNRETVRAEEAALAEKKSKKERLLASVKKEKASSAKMLRDLESASRKILEIIRDSERAEKRKEVPFSGKGFPGLRGKLPWPVEGKVAIPYGSQKDPQFSTPIFRSGTYIQANDNAHAKAVHGGKVVFAEWFKGYGQLVIVNHGEGYHTLYGSLSQIFIKVGDIIKGKQAVGKVGNSGILDTPGLYFEVRYKGKPLDPLQWLQRR